MWQYGIKILVTAVIVVAISEAAKRSTLAGSLIASLPLTSVLAMLWLYLDTSSLEKVASLSRGIFWIVIPSLVFFLIFPLLVKWGANFWLALAGACATTGMCYLGFIQVLPKIGIKI